MLTDRQTVCLAVFTIATSVFLLVSMIGAAVKHDCRVPPRNVSVTGAIVMEYACPDALDKTR